MSLFSNQKPHQQPNKNLSTYRVSINEFGTSVSFQATSPQEAGKVVDAINNLLTQSTHTQLIKLANKLNSDPRGVIKSVAKFC